MAQEREPSRRLTEDESGQDVHHGAQQEAEVGGVEMGVLDALALGGRFQSFSYPLEISRV